MPRLIDADALMEEIKNRCIMPEWCKILVQSVALSLPTIEERKTGKWMELDFTEAWEYRCDQCGRRSDFKENFCPNCGAEMRGEEHGVPK